MTNSARLILNGLLGILEFLEFLTEPTTIAIGLSAALYSWIAFNIADLLGVAG